MSRVFVHIDRLVLPHEGFDVGAFTRSLALQIAESSAPAGPPSDGVASIRVPPVRSGRAVDVGAAVGRAVQRSLR